MFHEGGTPLEGANCWARWTADGLRSARDVILPGIPAVFDYKKDPGPYSHKSQHAASPISGPRHEAHYLDTRLSDHL